jgi:ABC-type multidrug transport system fused ATPase/permease subunit
MEEPPHSKSAEMRSFSSFWFHGCWRAVKKTWENYAFLLIAFGVVYTIAAIWVLPKWDWLRKTVKDKDIDMNLLLTLVVPGSISLAFLLYHFFRAPYEIYKEIWEKAQQSEKSHEEVVGGINRINAGQIAALKSMNQRVQDELQSARNAKSKADEDYEKRKAAKVALSGWIAQIRIKEGQLRDIPEYSFGGEKADAFEKEMEELFHTIYDVMFNIYNMGAEANLFSTVKPQPIAPYGGYDLLRPNVERWRWRLSVMEAKYNELRKIVEAMPS